MKIFLIFFTLFISFNILAFAGGETAKDVNHYLIQARIQYDNSRYEEAIELCNKALALDPQNKEALDCAEKAIERSRAGLKQKKSERKPIEFNMIVNTPAPYLPPPKIEKPKSDTISLKGAIEIGLENHLPIQIALEQIKLSRFKEKEAFRELFPEATLRWDETSGRISSKDYMGRKYQLKLQHPLYHGGELKFTWEQAKVNLKIAQENYDKTKEDYILELTKAYYDYLKAIRNFNAQEALLKDLENDLAMAKKEHEVEVSSLVGFLNVQSQYNQAYYSYLSSENSLSLAKLNFLQLLSLDQDDGVKIKIDTELIFKECAIDLEECIKLAYENRADLKINDLSLQAAEFGEKVAKSQQSPKIDLTGTVGKAGEVATPGKLRMSDDWFIGAKASLPWGPNTMNYSYTNENIAPSLTSFQPTKDSVHSVRLNILDNLVSYTEAQRSEVTRQQAYSDLVKGKQTAATQVREAYFNYQESALKVKTSVQNRELYNRELAVMKEKRSMNEAETQDLVSAKIKLAGEDINYTSAVIENKIAIAKLNKAIGIRDHFK